MKFLGQVVKFSNFPRYFEENHISDYNLFSIFNERQIRNSCDIVVRFNIRSITVLLKEIKETTKGLKLFIVYLQVTY